MSNKTIYINRGSILADLRAAYRQSLSDRYLHHTVYLYSDGTTYDYTDVGGNSWLQGGGIVETVATYKPDESGSCIDAWLYGLSAQERVALYKEYMDSDEQESFVAALADPDRISDPDDICEIDDWVQDHTGAWDKVCDEAYDYCVSEADSNGDFDRYLDECLRRLQYDGYTIIED